MKSKCPVCGEELKETHRDILGEGTLAEQDEECPKGCYSSEFAYGCTTEKIGDKEWTHDQVETGGQRDKRIREMTEQIDKMKQRNFLPIKVRRVVKRTEKAILVNLDNGEQHWIPLSQVLEPDKCKQGTRNFNIKVAEWLVEQDRIGKSTQIPEDVVRMCIEARKRDVVSIGGLVDRIIDSDGSWLQDCIRLLVGMSAANKKATTIGDLLANLEMSEKGWTFKRIRFAIVNTMREINKVGKDDILEMPVDELSQISVQDFLNCPNFGKKSLVVLMTYLEDMGIILQGSSS